MPSHHTPLHAACARVVASAVGVAPEDLKVEAPPRAELGDLAVGCFKLGNKPPPVLAKEIAAAFVPDEFLVSAHATGPFVNFRANRAATLRWLVDATLRGELLP